MNKRILASFTLAALMMVLAFSVTTAAIAQSDKGEEKREEKACAHAGREHVPFCPEFT